MAYCICGREWEISNLTDLNELEEFRMDREDNIIECVDCCDDIITVDHEISVNEKPADVDDPDNVYNFLL